MKTCISFMLGICICLHLDAQKDTMTYMGVTPQQEEEYKKWIDNLYEIGVKTEGDSVYISEEAQKVATDTQYRKIIYPVRYAWPEAQYLFKQMHLKIGFWYLINIYTTEPEQKENVLKFIIPFDKLFEMDKVLISSFYTYALLDPTATTIVNGKPDIRHPERIEAKLAGVKEIVGYVLAQRAKEEKE